jgi:hypothetical protein
MSKNNPLFGEFERLVLQYRNGNTNLSILASRSESIVESLRVDLKPSDYSKVMNSIYLIEEINALALDEDREPLAVELDSVAAEIKKIEGVFGEIS